MKKPPRKNRHMFHFGVPGRAGTISVPVEVSWAKHEVTLDRSIEDVKRGKQGLVASCADAVCATRHADVFRKQAGHNIYYADFTVKRAYIVDKVKNGLPTHCVCYEHNDPTIPQFDKKGGKAKLINSGDAVRTITLRPPVHQEQPAGRPRGKQNATPKRVASRGATRRAIAAGLIAASAEQMAVRA